jgi:hypothetical protein
VNDENEKAWLARERETIAIMASRTGMTIAEVEREFAKMYRDQVAPTEEES